MELKFAASLDRKWLYPENPASVFLLLEVQAAEVKSRETRQNLGLVLDRSGSMAGAKLDYTKQAASFVAGHLGSEDFVSLTVFDSHVDVLYPGGALLNRDHFRARVETVNPGGSTNISGGTLAGFQEVRKNLREGQVNRVLLLTDGQANVGLTKPQELIRTVAQIREAGVTLSTFGLGEGFEEDLLMNMAEAGGGNFYYIDAPDSIPGIFAQELKGLLAVVAQNLRLKLTPGPGVKLMGAMGYSLAVSGTSYLANLADIYSGERKLLLVELGVAGHSGESWPLAQVKLEYTGVGEDLSLERTQVAITLPVTMNPGDALEENIDVVRQVELFRAAEARGRAIQEADKGNFQASRAILEEQIARMNELGLDSPQLKQAMNSLESDISFFCMDSYSAKARKQMQAESYRMKKGRESHYE
jgi:Ca-activated chloride channel family protein